MFVLLRILSPKRAALDYSLTQTCFLKLLFCKVYAFDAWFLERSFFSRGCAGAKSIKEPKCLWKIVSANTNGKMSLVLSRQDSLRCWDQSCNTCAFTWTNCSNPIGRIALSTSRCSEFCCCFSSCSWDAQITSGLKSNPLATWNHSNRSFAIWASID